MYILASVSLVLIVSFISSDSDGSSVIDSGDCGYNITWTYYDDGLLVVEGNGRMYDYDEEHMPWSDHYDSIKSIYLKGRFSYDYGFYGMSNLESIRTDYVREQVWFYIRDYTSFKEVILEIEGELAEDEPPCHVCIQLGTDYMCQFDLDDRLYQKDKPVHIFFHKFAKKEIPKEYKSTVGNGILLYLGINDYEGLPVEVTIYANHLYDATDDAKVTILESGEQLDTIVDEGPLVFKPHRSGHILISVEQMELIPYSIPIAIVIALIGIVGSIYYYLTKIRGGVKDGS